jgi:hypothetical protein
VAPQPFDIEAATWLRQGLWLCTWAIASCAAARFLQLMDVLAPEACSQLAAGWPAA